MTENITLEICTDSVASSLAAARAGAHRLELCAALPVGGLTPSTGTLRVIRQLVSLPLHVLIRPRSGDFYYSGEEFAVMRQDILNARELGAEGVVFGLLQPDGTIDRERTQELIALARPMSVTFHRAFDLCADPGQALSTLIELQVDRLLTSGQQRTAPQGADLIARLVEQPQNQLVIMPGAGINHENIAGLIRQTGAREFHMSLSQTIDSPMTFRRTHVHMGGTLPVSEYEHYQADATRIRQILNLMEDRPEVPGHPTENH